jgi:hypothetical protein
VTTATEADVRTLFKTTYFGMRSGHSSRPASAAATAAGISSASRAEWELWRPDRFPLRFEVGS